MMEPGWKEVAQFVGAFAGVIILLLFLPQPWKALIAVAWIGYFVWVIFGGESRR